MIKQTRQFMQIRVEKKFNQIRFAELIGTHVVRDVVNTIAKNFDIFAKFWMSTTRCVNFTNILQVDFLYKSYERIFSAH